MIEKDKAVINFINLIQNKDNKYKLATTIPDLYIDAKFGILDNGNYELSFCLKPEDKEKGIDSDYFLTRPFALLAPGQRIMIQNYDVIGLTHTLLESPSQEYTVEVKAFNGGIEDSFWTQSRQTAYIKFDHKLFPPHKFGVVFDLSIRNDDFKNALILNIANTSILLYYETVDSNTGYLIIWAKGKVDYLNFKAIIDSLLTSLGLLSGFNLENSIYYFAQRGTGINNIACRYENVSRSDNTNSPIIPSRTYNDIPEEKLGLSSQNFNELIKLLYNNEEYKRSAKLLINAGKETGCAKAALGAVALETITNVICKNLPIKTIVDNKQTAGALRNSLRKMLKEFKERITTNQFDLLKNNIDRINNAPNANKYIEAFNVVGIELDEEELYCLKCRNLFLHGKLPELKKYISLSQDELLDVVSNRLVMLSAMLLLKKAGYKGYVLDNGMTQVVKWRMVRNGEIAKTGNCLREIIKSDNTEE